MRNTAAPIPEGSIGLGSELARKLDGDFDGDYVFVVQDPDVVAAVRELHQSAPPRLERGAKERKQTPILGLERVAVENMGATGIGSPTWLIAAALASDLPECVPELSDQVQSAVESMKWSTEVDWISIGSLTASIVHPREVFAPAVRASAGAMILIHNHPSGEPSPSEDDIAVTRRLERAAELLGIRIVDHIVIGDGEYASFKELGLL